MQMRRAPFGTVLGDWHGVLVYSCNYKSVPVLGMLGGIHNHHEGQWAGVKYQCVELARRFLLITRGVVLDSIPNAYDIFKLDSVRRISDGARVRMTAHANGSRTLPTVGSLLVWAPQGYFRGTGHVAVITDVQRDHVDVIEQNVHDSVWPKGQSYSRRLRAHTDADGGYHIDCTYGDARIIGWMTVS